MKAERGAHGKWSRGAAIKLGVPGVSNGYRKRNAAERTAYLSELMGW